MNLIISVLKKDDLCGKKIIETIQKNVNDVEIIYEEEIGRASCRERV